MFIFGGHNKITRNAYNGFNSIFMSHMSRKSCRGRKTSAKNIESDLHCGIIETLFKTEFTVSDIAKIKFAPITYVKVKRSFNRYKSVLLPNRRAFNFVNLKQL
ncbi:Uncharacterized protein FWK35_00031548 [Aphis craccivora]|uniref:Uncharacterized protein n=1 Tax=Aphis craccivora TaxID=307492 RepID=A0A6G0Y6D7_APHCR|nr:Uncharacterized protein FWK35_00031548 [Aphis craccivora]